MAESTRTYGRIFGAIVAITVLGGRGFAAENAATAGADPLFQEKALRCIAFEDVAPEGLLRTRAELSFRHLQESYYQWPNLSTVNIKPFPGDAIGRTINGLTLLSRALQQPAPENLKEIVKRLPEVQNTDGYIGPKLPESRADEDVLAAHNGMLCGLSEYAAWTKDSQADDALKRIGDNLFVPVREAVVQYRPDPGVAATIEWRLSGGDIGQLFLAMDGLTRAYALEPRPALKGSVETFIARYRKLDLVKISAQTHAMLSATTGVLRWYDLHRRPDDLVFAEFLYKQYRERAMTETYENDNWFNRPEWTEACGVVDSFIDAVTLWRLTGKAEYLADAHHILYNGLLAGQLPNGGFGSGPCVGSPDKQGHLQVSTETHHEAPFCCSMRGAEGLARAIQYGYFLDGAGVVLPFYADSTATLRFADGVCTVRQTTRYPHEGQVSLEVLDSTVSGEKTVRWFLPPWSEAESVSLAVRGQRVPVQRRGSFAVQNARLSKGDVLELTFKQMSGKQSALHAERLPGVSRYFRGPLLLGADGGEPSEPILDRLDPLKKREMQATVLFLEKGSRAPVAQAQSTQPVDLAQGAARYSWEAKGNAETESLFQSLKHDRDSAICGVVWKQPQQVTQVILQWPEQTVMPEPGAVVVRWSVAGELRQAKDPGVIGTGRQWVYALALDGKTVELNNVVVAFDHPARSAKGAAIPAVVVLGR